MKYLSQTKLSIELGISRSKLNRMINDKESYPNFPSVTVGKRDMYDLSEVIKYLEGDKR